MRSTWAKKSNITHHTESLHFCQKDLMQLLFVAVLSLRQNFALTLNIFPRVKINHLLSSQLYPFHNHEVRLSCFFLFTAWCLLFLAFRMTALNSSDYLMKRLRALNLSKSVGFFFCRTGSRCRNASRRRTWPSRATTSPSRRWPSSRTRRAESHSLLITRKLQPRGNRFLSSSTLIAAAFELAPFLVSITEVFLAIFCPKTN